jgi:hypothetical protein
MEEEKEEFSLEQMEEETKRMLRLRYLNRDNAKFERTPGGFVSLVLKDEGDEKKKSLYGTKKEEEEAGKTVLPDGSVRYARVNFYAGFPFTEPGRYISVRETTEKAAEIGVIEELERDVDAETVSMIKEQLEIRYFTPVITKINNIKEEHGFAYCDVETGQGRCRFTVRMNSNSVVYLNDVRLLITDLDENRFEIPDFTVLSGRELKKLDLFL